MSHQDHISHTSLRDPPAQQLELERDLVREWVVGAAAARCEPGVRRAEDAGVREVGGERGKEVRVEFDEAGVAGEEQEEGGWGCGGVVDGGGGGEGGREGKCHRSWIRVVGERW